jgi:hypothetical protein
MRREHGASWWWHDEYEVEYENPWTGSPHPSWWEDLRDHHLHRTTVLTDPLVALMWKWWMGLPWRGVTSLYETCRQPLVGDGWMGEQDEGGQEEGIHGLPQR